MNLQIGKNALTLFISLGPNAKLNGLFSNAEISEYVYQRSKANRRCCQLFNLNVSYVQLYFPFFSLLL